VRIEFLKENLTFTGEDSPMATLLLSVMGAFAEFERALIRELGISRETLYHTCEPDNMPRRRILTSVERASLLAVPAAEADRIRHFSLSEGDLSVIRQRRGAHNRLGFAVQLCTLRYPGIALAPGESPPEALLGIVARQLRVDLVLWPKYAEREVTRREHGEERNA
jgi:DNA-binding phage protein